MLRVFQKVIVQLGLLVIPGIHLSGLFLTKRELRTWEKVCVHSIWKRLVANQRNGIILWWTPKHGYHPSRRVTHFAQIHGEGTPSARDVTYSSEINFTDNWEDDCQ